MFYFSLKKKIGKFLPKTFVSHFLLKLIGFDCVYALLSVVYPEIKLKGFGHPKDT